MGHLRQHGTEEQFMVSYFYRRMLPSRMPQTHRFVIAFPEHALEWQDHVVDFNPYVSDPLYGVTPSDVSDFPAVIWNQDEVDGKRFGCPSARQPARTLLLYQPSRFGAPANLDSSPPSNLPRVRAAGLCPRAQSSGRRRRPATTMPWGAAGRPRTP